MGRATPSASGKEKEKGKKDKNQWECPYCSKTYPNETKSLKCDTCGNWVCLQCTKIHEQVHDVMHELNNSDSDNGIKWICKLDQRSMPTLKEMSSTLTTIMQSNNERFDAIEAQVKRVEGSISEKVTEEVASLKDQLMTDISEE